jgi:hypothetical protein
MKILINCCVTLVVWSCVNLVYGQNIAYDKIKDFQIEKMEGKNLTIRFNAELENPFKKNLGVTVKKGKIFKDGQYFGRFYLPKKIKLRRKSSGKHEVIAHVVLEKEFNLLEEGMVMMLSGRKIDLKISGKLKATWLIFWKRFPFEYQQKISPKDFMK